MKYIITKEDKIIAETHNEDLAKDYLKFMINNIHYSEHETYNIHAVKEDKDIIDDMNAIRI